MEKTTKELMEEKEAMIKEYDQKIYESSLKSMERHRLARDKRRAEKQELEDKGWLNRSFYESAPEPEIAIIIEPKEEEPEPEPEPKSLIEKSEREKALLAEIEKLKEQKALLEAARDMEKPNEVEIVPIIEEEESDNGEATDNVREE